MESLLGLPDDAERDIAQRGLFYAGSTYQYRLTSRWLGGTGRDKEFVWRAMEAWVSLKFSAQMSILVKRFFIINRSQPHAEFRFLLSFKPSSVTY